MKKFEMFTQRYMDEEERQVLVGIRDGKWATVADLEADTNTNGGGLMADFGMLSISGYVGFHKDGLLVLTKAGQEAANDG